MTHWAAEYIGRPWRSGAMGPDEYNCWGLVITVQKRYFRRDLPDILVDEDSLELLSKAFVGHPERRRWKDAQTPKNGDLALLSRAQNPIHIGVWLDLDGGGVLHSTKALGVVFQKEQSLLANKWKIDRFLTYGTGSNS